MKRSLTPLLLIACLASAPARAQQPTPTQVPAQAPPEAPTGSLQPS